MALARLSTGNHKLYTLRHSYHGSTVPLTNIGYWNSAIEKGEGI